MGNQRRFVIVSDLHIHAWSAFARGDGINNSRLQRTLQVLDDTLNYASTHKIPWLFAGDLVHTAGFAFNSVLAGLTEVFGRYPEVEKVAVWGNHDARGVGGRIELDHTVFRALLHAVPNLTVLNPGEAQPVGGNWIRPGTNLNGAHIIGTGFQPRADLLQLGEEGADIGLFHQTVRGSISPHGFELQEGIEAEQLLRACRVSVVGHVHHPQQVDAPKGQAILIPGSPEHHNFGDKGEHGWWVLTLPEDKSTDPEVEFMPGGSPEFRTVDTPEQIQDDGHFYRVRAVPKGTTLPDHATAIAPTPTTVEERDILRGVSEVEEILQVWLREHPPEGEDLELEQYLTIGRQLLEAQDPVRLRPVRLRKLVLSNFCSYEQATLPVEDGIKLVTGQGRDFPSNGSGKTTATGEALYWLIFGTTTKGLSADEVIRWGAEECSVTGIFVEGEQELVVKRSRGKSGPALQVIVDGEPWEAASVNEMTGKLARYLGLTPEIYQNLGYFSQEKLLLFSSATDGERKGVMSDLIGLSAYQEAASAAGAEGGELGKQQAGLEAKRAAWAESVDREQLALLSAQERVRDWEMAHQAELVKTEASLEGCRKDPLIALLGPRRDKAVARLESRLASRRTVVEAERGAITLARQAQLSEATRARIGHLQAQRDAQLATLPGGLEQAQQLVAGLPAAEQRVADANAAILAAREEAQRRVQEWKALDIEAGVLRQELRRAETELGQVAASLGSGICPSCRQAITEEHRAEHLAEAEAKVAEIVGRVSAAEAAANQAEEATHVANAAHSRALEAAQAAVALRDSILSLGRTLREVERLEGEIQSLGEAEAQAGRAAAEWAESEIQRKLDRLQSIYSGRTHRVLTYVEREQAAWRRRVERLEGELSFLQRQPNPYEAEVEGIRKRIGDFSQRATEAAGEIARTADRIAVYDYWRKGFSRQGIQSLLVEEVAVLFNRHRSSIFPVLTQGVYDVQFSTLSRTKAGEARERTEFLIYQRGELVPYGALSGGQRRRVDIGIMLTLSKAVAEWMGVPGVLGVMTLDEVFGFLDDSGAEGLLEALRVVQETIPTIFTITHDAHLQSLFPDVIRVEQDERGISHLV